MTDIPLREYWKSLNFEYVKTYSGLRGEKFEKFQEENEVKINQLKEELKTVRFMQQSKINAKIEDLENKILAYNTCIINLNKELHPSAIEITQEEKTSNFVSDLDHILNQECKSEIFSPCMPVYRDAIAFFSKKSKITGIIHICFSCNNIINENEEILDNIDADIYPKLKILLSEIGHQIK